MVIINGIENLTEKYRHVVLTIGNFDGVHIGHQKIFANVRESAEAAGGTAMAVTFDPHPLKIITPERRVRILTPFAEKARLMEFFGIDVFLSLHFDREFANMTPDDFIRNVIVDRIGAKEVIVGHNYSFGRGKKGGTSLLRRKSRKYGFSFRVIRYARLYGEVASSSRIRSLIARGRVCESSWLLGRPYMIEGMVVKGAGRGGSMLGVPTANIETNNELVPKEGVYAVKACLKERVLDGVINIGRNPTFGEQSVSYEVHLFDVSENILGENLRVNFVDRIRDEKRFRDVKMLHDSIMRDIARAKEILSTKRYPRLI